MEREGSVAYSQDPAIGPYSESVESGPKFHITFL